MCFCLISSGSEGLVLQAPKRLEVNTINKIKRENKYLPCACPFVFVLFRERYFDLMMKAASMIITTDRTQKIIMMMLSVKQEIRCQQTQ